MPSTTRRTTRQTSRRTARQTALETTKWTFHPTVQDATDTKKGIIDKDALKCCDYCDNENAGFWCRQCGEARYCSASCGAQDWPHHGKLCASSLGQFSLFKRPKGHVRGVIFDINSHKPSFIWLDTTNFPLSVAQALNIEVEDVQPPSDINSDIPHRRMHHGVQEYYPHRYSRSEGQGITQFNRSTATLGRPGLLKFHYCSFLYTGFRLSKSGRSIVYEDITMKDFRAIIDFLQITATHPNNIIVDLKRFPVPTSVSPANKFRPWPAVKINCGADVKRLSCLSEGNQWALVEDIVVPPVSKEELLYLPSLCGLHWIGEFLVDESLATREKRNYGGRIFTHVLTRDKTGRQRQSLNLHCGSLYIVHKGGAPIHPNHILAFFEFTEMALTEIQKQITSSSTNWVPEFHEFLPSLQQLRPWFTRKKFSEFWEWWMSNPQVEKMSYKHNVGGSEWYPFGSFFDEAIPWSPYSFTPKPRPSRYARYDIYQYLGLGLPYQDTGEWDISDYDIYDEDTDNGGVKEYRKALKDVFDRLADSSMW
ncbi:hypothetical protein F5Y06DRAFT_271769 [Hypoxylon sp. FL0890]|nr:hypothetical protein F5Y06DRAFT_271769 [Hypoxylon sp. FL0890]